MKANSPGHFTSSYRRLSAQSFEQASKCVKRLGESEYTCPIPEAAPIADWSIGIMMSRTGVNVIKFSRQHIALYIKERTASVVLHGPTQMQARSPTKQPIPSLQYSPGPNTHAYVRDVTPRASSSIRKNMSIAAVGPDPPPSIVG